LLDQKAAELLGLPPQPISAAIDACPREGQKEHDPSAVIVSPSSADREPEKVYLMPYLASEAGVADRLAWLIERGEQRSRVAGSTLLLASIISGDDITGQQRQAVENALRFPVSVMTGGPGTGKSYTVATLINALEEMGKKYALAAPTGRAAKRLTEATGRKASTLHRLMAFVPDRDEPEELMIFDDPTELNLDLIVVDEASMLDLPLAYRLLRAIPGGCHLLLVGDVDQLPSVGAGNFLRDVIASGAVPVTRLTEIFRQAAASKIVANAHRINAGNFPILDNDGEGDFFFFNIENGTGAAEQVVGLVTERIPKKFGFQPPEIQVLSPMYRGDGGVKNLNTRLQDALNPAARQKKERSLAGTRFREGDRVMQIKNEYDKEVFNGDIGRLIRIDEEESTLLVEMDGRGIIYDFNEADQLVLAYCSTIHKAQGSEYPCIVMVMLNEHQVMLARNLLYTGITRAQKLCVLISNRKAISAATANDRVASRFSALSERIQKSVHV
jgi:exodeoxyribonuclease V alpha subunit